MRRRDLLKYAGAAALAAPFVRAARADQATVKIGVVGPKTGPLAPGAAVTHFPPWRLWAHQVNEKGGLNLKDGQRKVELIEYDDRTQPPEAIKAVERLASVDKVDWIVGLYGTGFNVAAVPTFAKLGYPQIPVACVTELSPQLVKKYPLLFFGNGTLTHYCTSAIDILKKFRDSGEIGNKVAMVNIADEYGIEISNISKTLFPAAGFDIVYNKSYPLGTQDYAPVIKGAKATNPDAFIAWSYPPDTFGLTEQAKIENFNVKAYYNGIGCAFPGFAGKFGSAAENVLGFGGTPNNEKTRAFYKLHKEVTGVDADFNGSPLYYANGQVLTQAIEGAGSIDRDAVTAHLKSHTYQTMLGEYDLRNQLLNRLYTAGQWQGGWFHAVAGVGYPDSDYVPVKLKTSWA
jgi:branched-chain amino acid transport system substrate-binding protein